MCLTMLLGIVPVGTIGASATTVLPTYTVNGVKLPLTGYESMKTAANYPDAPNCWQFAQMVYKKLWNGQTFTSSAGTKDDMFRNCDASQQRITEANTKSFINFAALGAVIRVAETCSGGDGTVGLKQHSMILIGKDSNGFRIYDSNVLSSDGRRVNRIKYYTWSEFANSFKSYIYFKYIKWPNAGAYTSNIVIMPTITTSNYVGGVKVTLASKTSGATIYYTTDGKNPTTSSTKYSGAFNLTAGKTVKAIAVKSGMSNSCIASKSVTVSKIAAPVISNTATANGFNVTIKAKSGETIYYTTNGSDPTTSSTKYTAGFSVTENATVKAIAVKSGCANSSVASLSLTASVPGAPSLKLKSFDTIGVNDDIELSWSAVAGAASYKLIVSGAESKELDLGNVTTTTYIAAKAGTYSFTLKAVNFKGESAASSPAVTVTVKPDVTVTFKVDGNTYAAQTVRYGTSAAEPAKPTKNGYDFDSWDKSFKNVTANTTVNATFKAKKYTIKFLADDGSEISKQSVEFGKAATVPSSSPVKDGYVFRGWALVNDSGSGTSYTKVDGDASFKPVFVWADPTLPVSVTIGSAVRADDSRSYAVSIKVTNSKAQKFNAKAVAVIKTANDKVVASAIQNIEIPASASSKAYTIVVNSNESAMLCEVYIVNGDVKNAELTGGALSSKASKAVTKNASTSVKEWSAWSSWSTDAATKTDTLDVETKTQYSYRDKSTVTSYNSTMDGYTKVGEQWVDQGNTTVEYAENLPKGSTTTKYFKTDSANYVKYNNASKVKKAADSTDTVKYEQVSKTVIGYLYWHWCYTHDAGSPQNCYLADHKGQVVSGSRTCNNFHSLFSTKALSYNSSKGCYVKNSKADCPYQENWYAGLDNKQITVYRYVYKTYKKLYTFEKLSEESGWSDTKPVESDSRIITTRTLYRTRKLEDKSVTASTEYKVTENTSGTKHTVSGNISNLSVDYSGKKATVMVYRTNNTDSTANQLEYVGQITLGSNNSYSVSFIPKEELSAATGDFVVALGIASADKEITANRIEAPKQQYKVDFLDLDGKVISSQNIEQGKDATPPALPSKEGYIVTWSDSYKYINSNRTIRAEKTAKTYPVVFVDWANSEVLSIQEVEYDSAPRFPANPSAEGKIFKGWSLDSGSKITDTTVIEAIYDDITYTVKFLNKDGSVFETQTVPYGGFASVPENNPTASGFEFVAWDSATAWWNIKADTTVKPVFIYDKTVETPIASNDAPSFRSGMLDLETGTEGAEIHYTTDGSEPTQESFLFEDIIFVEQTTTFKAKAFKNGMNDSDTAEFTIDVSDESGTTSISALTDSTYFTVGETTASVSARIDNPFEYTIKDMGLYVTDSETGESKLINANPLPTVSSKPVVKKFNLTGFEKGTTYEYEFFIVFDVDGEDYYLSTATVNDDVCGNVFTTLGENDDDDPVDPVVTDGLSVKIKTPSTTTVKYGYTLVLHAEVNGELPEGAKVVWKESSSDAFKATANGLTAKATAAVKGEKTISVWVVDADGKAIKNDKGENITASVTLTAKVGFFQKLSYFFKNLFGANLIIDA